MVNGQIPSQLLAPIPGTNAGLLKPAALAYRAMHFRSLKVTGVSLHLIDGSIGRAYRNFARQVIARQFWCAQGKCGNAAEPGTSNHGLGTTVDLMTLEQRSAIDRVGEPFGFAKRWSDAPHEWWHIRWQDMGWKPRPDPLRKLGKRQRAAAERLLFHRRERKAEGRSGHGPRWRRHDRWVRFWLKRVERLHRRAGGERKAVLGRVLRDRDGNI